ncbi:MAG: hypothetical protein JO145_07755, partial [Acidobacteriaceae bacterium]|nr:hypothetical protein [Acidobacteriaceae bacterium]
MSKELVIGSNRHETKVAILEDDQLVEVYFQRANEYSLAGSIHKGRVTRVLPGMQSAFVDLGLERDTFLYVSDFFEEHEDFEPLGDDKPIRDRRDRRPNRSSERPIEERAPQPREARPFIAEPASAEPVGSEPETPERAEVAEDAAGLPAAEFKPVNGDAVSNGQGGDRTDPDRGFRGDRRGRRSRRRRQRGRGFPENKYAQPISPPPATEAPRPASVEEEEGRASSVIILPGESLAKYRNVSSAAEPSDEGEHDAADTTAPLPEIERDAAEEEAIEAEAEEIELAEKVLAHHDDETPADVEEKIEEVKQDQPIPLPSETTNSEVTDAPVAEIQQDVPEGEALEVDEFEVIDVEPTEVEDVVPDTEVEEATEDIRPVPEGSAEPKQTAELPRAQTASIREQSGPYMHRLPRRLRRRRGNRFSQQNQEFAGTGTMGAAAGAAPALEPGARIDQRRDQERDQPEERSTERSERPMPSIT